MLFLKKLAIKMILKHWKKLVLLVAIGVLGIALIPFAIIQYAFWYEYDCKPQMELYEQDANSTESGEKCDEKEDVLKYEPVEETTIIEIGQKIYDARKEVMTELKDKEALQFLDEYDISDTTLHHPGDDYRLLKPSKADGFYNTPPEGENVGGGAGGTIGTGGTYTGGSTSTGGPRVYSPNNTKETYWQWAQDVSAATGWHPLFVMAQWTQEIGWDFHSNNFEKNNNMAGQTWHSGLPESMKGTARPSNEGGYYIRYDDAVDGYIDFILNNKRYSNVATFSTPEEQAAEVARQGWATDPNYYNALVSIINRYRKDFGDSGVAAPAPNNGDKIVAIAQRYLAEMGTGQQDTGKRVSYLMGGGRLQQGGAADCSDFSQAVYKEAGINIGGYTVAQMYESGGEFVDGVENLAPGDLVFFHNPGTGHGYANEYNGKTYRISHVGVYVGNGEIIHLSYGNGTIAVDKVTSGYYKDHFVVGKRWLEPGTGSYSYQPDLEQGSVNEAEIHLRGLEQSDMHALEALELTQEILESDEYKGTKVNKTWLITRAMQEKGKEAYNSENESSPYYAIYKRSVENEEKFEGMTWLERNMNWLLFAQYEVYKCYMLGDEKAEGIGWLWMNIFGLGEKPCQTIDDLLKEEGGVPPFVIPEEQDQVRQQHVIIQDRWECMEKDAADGPEPKEDRIWHKNEYHSPGPKPDCGPEMKAVNVRTHQSYNTYQKLIEILYDFEPYAMHEVNKTVDEKDLNYPDLIKYIIGGVYEEMTDGGFILMPSSDWIVPMEQGTYNFSSPFGMRTYDGETAQHNGIDMGTRGVQRVPVYASAAGTVIAAGMNGSMSNNGGYGAIVTIDHGNGYYSMYAHFQPDDIVVEVGQQVQQAQLLGGAGNNPNVDWHLHFEICKDTYDASGGVQACKAHEDPQDFVEGLSTDQSQQLSEKRANQFTGALDYSGEDAKWNKMKERAKSEVILMPGYTPTAGNEKGGGFLGDWVKEFESGENGPSAYWKDPVGGNSLGVYQMTEKQANGGKGSLYGFGDFLKEKYTNYYEKLNPYDPSSDGFVSKWIALGKADPVGFASAQHTYMKISHYDDIYKKVVSELGFDPNERSRGVREALWSSAVQIRNLTVDVFKEAIDGKDVSSMSDEELIQRIYDAKINNVPNNFASSSKEVQDAIIQRYKDEKQKILSEMSKCGC